ncbi:MAG: hypothetical protein AAFR55_07685, partial [Pseudomonadota bacterium]
TGTGTQQPVFRIYTVTPTSAAVSGVRPSAFDDAFPDLPDDFLLAGVAYSIVRGRTIQPQNYQNAYRWRGGLGLGEPQVTVVANFNRMYDPREAGHDVDDASTWTASNGNPAIIWAWWRTAPFGRNQPMSTINWDKVASEANKCDQTVTDRSGSSIPRYRCGVAFPDSKPRQECEREILETMDAFPVYDDDGKVWPRVGVYEAPTLTFTADQDIITEQTEIVDDGEAQIDGVIVEYISPDHGYTKQPCSPWLNPNYYDASRQPNFRTIQRLGCQDHNQAVRLAKTEGLRGAPTKKAALGTTIKGILAKGERTITLDLDDEFRGAFEIATPVVEAPTGTAASFAVVPMQTDRYDLGDGEEGPPPALAPILNIDDTLEVADNVDVLAQTVDAASGSSVRLIAAFDAPSRSDRFFRFRFVPTGTSTAAPEYFVTDMDEGVAQSPIVSEGTEYSVSWQTMTAGGRATEWSDERDTPESITITPNASDAPGALSGVAGTRGAGSASFTGTGADTGNFRGVRVYRAAVGAGFNAATLVEQLNEVGRAEAFTVVAGAALDNILANGDFSTTDDWTPGTDWTIADGKANKASGSSSVIAQTVTLAAATDYRFAFDMTGRTSGNVEVVLAGDTNVDSSGFNSNATHFGTLTSPTNPTEFRFSSNPGFNGSVDNAVLFPDGAPYLDQGAADFYVVPVSFSGAEGTPAGPFTLTII